MWRTDGRLFIFYDLNEVICLKIFLFISPLNLPWARKVLQSYNKSVCEKVF